MYWLAQINKYCLSLQGCFWAQDRYLENDIFPGQGKLTEFCDWSGKFRTDLKSQGTEFESKMIREYTYCA